MRGRTPRPLSLSDADRAVLEQLSRSRSLPWSYVQRAKALLGLENGARVQKLAEQLQCSSTTLWRWARRYECRGLDAALVEAPRSGRPVQISPPATGAAHPVGVSGADR